MSVMENSGVQNLDPMVPLEDQAGLTDCLEQPQVVVPCNAGDDKIDPFLLSALNNPRDRILLLKLDHELERFVNDSTKQRLEFPPMSSYQRLIVHRVAQYFLLDHAAVDVDNLKRAVVLFKSPQSRIPVLRFTDLREEPDAPPQKAVKIMRRAAGASGRHHSDGLSGSGDRAQTRQTLEERETEYAKARARIFNETPPTTSSSSSPSSSSSTVPTTSSNDKITSSSSAEGESPSVSASSGDTESLTEPKNPTAATTNNTTNNATITSNNNTSTKEQVNSLEFASHKRTGSNNTASTKPRRTYPNEADGVRKYADTDGMRKYADAGFVDTSFYTQDIAYRKDPSLIDGKDRLPYPIGQFDPDGLFGGIDAYMGPHLRFDDYQFTDYAGPQEVPNGAWGMPQPPNFYGFATARGAYPGDVIGGKGDPFYYDFVPGPSKEWTPPPPISLPHMNSPLSANATPFEPASHSHSNSSTPPTTSNNSGSVNTTAGPNILNTNNTINTFNTINTYNTINNINTINIINTNTKNPASITPPLTTSASATPHRPSSTSPTSTLPNFSSMNGPTSTPASTTPSPPSTSPTPSDTTTISAPTGANGTRKLSASAPSTSKAPTLTPTPSIGSPPTSGAVQPPTSTTPPPTTQARNPAPIKITPRLASPPSPSSTNPPTSPPSLFPPQILPRDSISPPKYHPPSSTTPPFPRTTTPPLASSSLPPPAQIPMQPPPLYRSPFPPAPQFSFDSWGNPHPPPPYVFPTTSQYAALPPHHPLAQPHPLTHPHLYPPPHPQFLPTQSGAFGNSAMYGHPFMSPAPVQKPIASLDYERRPPKSTELFDPKAPPPPKRSQAPPQQVESSMRNMSLYPTSPAPTHVPQTTQQGVKKNKPQQPVSPTVPHALQKNPAQTSPPLQPAQKAGTGGRTIQQPQKNSQPPFAQFQLASQVSQTPSSQQQQFQQVPQTAQPFAQSSQPAQQLDQMAPRLLYDYPQQQGVYVPPDHTPPPAVAHILEIFDFSYSVPAMNTPSFLENPIFADLKAAGASIKMLDSSICIAIFRNGAAARKALENWESESKSGKEYSYKLRQWAPAFISGVSQPVPSMFEKENEV